MADGLPSGFFNASGLEKYSHQVLDDLNQNDSFDNLQNELFIIATELDSGRRAIFGPGYIEAPISKAVSASSAIPLIYKPIEINGSEYIDGALNEIASLDLAVQKGAKLIICINPFVPWEKQGNNHNLHSRHKVDPLSSKGIRFIATQAFRTVLHSNLIRQVNQLNLAHPDVDILMIEPKSADYQMFFHNPISYVERKNIAHHGFQSVILDLVSNYPAYEELFSRHGISISLPFEEHELSRITEGGQDTNAIEEVFNKKLGDWHPPRMMSSLQELDKTLAALEITLDRLSQKAG
jgi:hypothetical protein